MNLVAERIALIIAMKLFLKVLFGRLLQMVLSGRLLVLYWNSCSFVLDQRLLKMVL
jgi:hypothetical protein